jgi:GTP-binding protein HflX
LVEVQRVLHDIGADRVPQVLVYNKLDRLEPSQRPRESVDTIARSNGESSPRVFVSALTGQGIDLLRAVLAGTVAGVGQPDLHFSNRATAVVHASSEVDDDADLAEHSEPYPSRASS